MVKTYNEEQLLAMNLPLGTIIITNGYEHHGQGFIYGCYRRTMLQTVGQSIFTLWCKDLLTGETVAVSNLTGGLM